MSATFHVSKQTAQQHGREAFERASLGDLLTARLGDAGEARGVSGVDLIAPGRTPGLDPRDGVGALYKAHPLLLAVHLAFDKHLPLVMSPDDVWLCIAQGFALHVHQHAEALRHRFVRHEGQTQLRVVRDDFVRGSEGNDWPAVFASFGDQIAEQIGTKLRALVVADCSTTGPIERAASEVTLMATVQSYFKYRLLTRCGIPEISLLGGVDDWKRLKTRAKALAEYGAGAWVKALGAVLDEFIAAAAGRPSVVFWQSLYKLHTVSGGSLVSGWINVFFPYIEDPTTLVPRANPFALTWRESLELWHPGPDFNEFPSGLLSAPLAWEFLGEELAMELVSGFVAVRQDAASLALRPAQGWVVRSRPEPQALR